MTHEDLVKRAARWLSNTRRCVLVATETSTAGGESPDAIGWRASGLSTLVECKASRADFHRDKRKPWRLWAEGGMGMARFYMTPKGLLKPEELPDGWGLLEIRGRVVRVVKDAKSREYHYGERREIALAVQIARRVENGWGAQEKIIMEQEQALPRPPK